MLRNIDKDVLVLFIQHQQLMFPLAGPLIVIDVLMIPSEKVKRSVSTYDVIETSGPVFAASASILDKESRELILYLEQPPCFFFFFNFPSPSKATNLQCLQPAEERAEQWELKESRATLFT